MRSNVAFLVLLMVMLACFAVVDFRGLGHQHALGIHARAGNLVVAAGLLLGAAAAAWRRPWSYALSMAGAGFAVAGGLLSLRNLLWTALPGLPVIWIVAGLYLMMRLSLNRHGELQAATRQRGTPDAAADGPAGP